MKAYGATSFVGLATAAIGSCLILKPFYFLRYLLAPTFKTFLFLTYSVLG